MKQQQNQTTTPRAYEQYVFPLVVYRGTQQALCDSWDALHRALADGWLEYPEPHLVEAIARQAQEAHDAEIRATRQAYRPAKSKGAMMVMAFVKTGNVQASEMEDLLMTSGLLKVLQAEYVACDVEEPAWVSKRLREVRHEMQRRLEEEVAKLEAELEALKDKEVKRQDLQAKLAKLQSKTGGV
jgi:hypothetical protein